MDAALARAEEVLRSVREVIDRVEGAVERLEAESLPPGVAADGLPSSPAG